MNIDQTIDTPSLPTQEMNINIGEKEVVLFTIFFTTLALYYNQNHILSFVLNHAIALVIALIQANLINTFLLQWK